MNVTRTTTWIDNQVLTAAALNGEFNNLLNAPNIVNADIAGGAAIAYAKLNLAAAIQNSDLAGGITYSKLSLSGGIVNGDISNTAAIATSKLALGISGSVVGTTDTQTLSSKTLTKPIINGSQQGLTTDTDGGTVTFDMSASNIHTVVIAGNRTFAVTNVAVGQAFVIRVVQDATGSRVVSWFATIKWPGGSAPTLTTTGNKTDVIGFLCTSSGNFDGYILGTNL